MIWIITFFCTLNSWKLVSYGMALHMDFKINYHCHRLAITWFQLPFFQVSVFLSKLVQMCSINVLGHIIGRVAGPFDQVPMHYFRFSPIGIVAKKRRGLCFNTPIIISLVGNSVISLTHIIVRFITHGLMRLLKVLLT